MLYSPTQFQRDQLLTDLLAVRERLTTAWSKAGWGSVEQACLVGTAQVVCGTGFANSCPDMAVPAGQRLGRTLAAIYVALRGPNAPVNIPMSRVMGEIMQFNDLSANHGAVLLLLDRAVAQVQESAGATVTASA